MGHRVRVPTFGQHRYRHDASNVASRRDRRIYAHRSGERSPFLRDSVSRPMSLSDCRKNVPETLTFLVLYLTALQLFHDLRIDPNRPLSAVIVSELRNHSGRVSLPDNPFVDFP